MSEREMEGGERKKRGRRGGGREWERLYSG